MRIDLPLCNLKTCRYSFDGNCISKTMYEQCEYTLAKEERPHGEWIPFEWDDNYETKIPLPKGSDSHMEEYWAEEFMCSVCGKAHHARSFCPFCGASMKEGERNE